MKKVIFFLFLLLVFGGSACQNEPIAPTSDAVTNFEYLWKRFDEMYGNFGVKNIDWNALHQKYRPQLNEQSTSGDLYHVLTQLIDELDDNHVNIRPTDPKFEPYQSDATHAPLLHLPSLEVVKANYLTEVKIATPEITYGLLSGNIGYIDITSFEDNVKNYEKNLDLILQHLQDTKALVLDIRNHWGGFDERAQYIAGRFADSKYLYLKSRKRNGPAHTNFTNWQEWYVQPTGKTQYRKPIILLTSDYTVSAAETFTMALKRLPHVRQVGITTSGAISDMAVQEMPNGWQFTLSVGEYLDHNGLSWEGKGLKPDVEVTNTEQELLAGKDRMLERAMELLQ